MTINNPCNAFATANDTKRRSTLYRELNRNSEEEKSLPKAAQIKTE